MATDTNTYTVTRKDGDVIARGLSAYEAMDAILSYDGYRWEVRAEKASDGETLFGLYTSSQSDAACGYYEMDTAYIGAWAKSGSEAMSIIAQKVIHRCRNWRDSPDCCTDAEYDAMLARTREELGDVDV